jgi:hypothetical protein
MLQAHSFLWHYLVVAPNLLLFALGFLIWQRGIARQFPIFLWFIALSGVCHLALYAADLAPFITAIAFWRIYWASLLIEGVLKFVLIAEIFAQSFAMYSSLARIGKILIRALGALLVLAAALAAAFAAGDSRHGMIVSGAHLLEQTICLIETGLLGFIFLFSAYFRLRLPRPILGIAVGLCFSACVHLGAWALVANGSLTESARTLTDFLLMGSYHVSVLIWMYYLLLPHKITISPVAPLPENNLAIWNRELERLLHQ